MERCDFCSVMAIIRKYIGESYDISQTDLLYELFAAFANDEQNHEVQLSLSKQSSISLSSISRPEQ